MAELRPDGEDILRATSAPSPRGAHYANGRTDLYLGRAHTSAADLMVARHEATHFRLTSHTAFGMLAKAVYADVMGTHGDLDRLRALLDVTRRTQEIAATAVGLWTTSADADKLLAPYPDYRVHLEDARHLARGLHEGSYGAVLLVEQACRAAMQIPLLHIVPDPARWGALGPNDLPEALFPDTRLQVLLDADVALASTICPDNGRLPASLPPRPGTDEDEFLRWYYGQSEWVFNYAAAVLRRSGGHTSASFNGHSLESAMLADPEERGRLFHHGRASARIHVRDVRMALAVDEATADLISDHEQPNCLLVTRPLAHLLDQYAITEDAADRLRGAAKSTVVTALRRLEIVDGRLAARLTVFDSPAQLGRIADASKVFVASVCSSVMHSDWAREWLPAMNEIAGPISILVDSDVDHFTEQMRISLLMDAGATPRIEADQLTFELAGDERIALAYLRIVRTTDDTQDLLSLSICDPDSAVGLARTWSEQFGAQADGDESTRALLGWLVGQLVYGEPWFDFGAPLLYRSDAGKGSVKSSQRASPDG